MVAKSKFFCGTLTPGLTNRTPALDYDCLCGTWCTIVTG